MRLYNDQNFNLLYDEEFEKIPFFFRFGEMRIKIVVPATIVSVVMTVVFAIWAFVTKTLVMTLDGLNYDLYEFVYNPVLVKLMWIFGAVSLVLCLWLFLSKYFEKRAFKKASNLAQMIALSENHKNEVERQNRSMWR